MSGRGVVRRAPEVLEPEEAWAHPVERRDQQPVVIYLQAPVPVVDEAEPEVSKAIPWLLIALALAILLFSLYAAWHTWVGPQLVPVRQGPVDLVGPSR